MHIKIADRMNSIPPYPFAIIAKRIAEIEAGGNSVIRLDMGSPDLPPPDSVIEALNKSAHSPSHHGYGGFVGIAALRQAFADYYAHRFEVELDRDREILPLIGSKEGIVNLSLALLNPSDIVLVPDLAYSAYAAGAYFAGAEPFEVHLDPANAYLPDLEAIPAEILKRAKLLWVNYPHNPTGSIARLSDYEKIVEFAEEHSILICSDNPYADIAFDGIRPPSVLEVNGAKNLAVEFNSLSKIYNMAGWRVGVCAGNAEAIDALLQVKSNIDSGLFRAIQDAACVALTTTSNSWIADRNAIYQRRRDVVVNALTEIGLIADPPLAGIYVWAEVKDGDDQKYATDALEQAFVSVTPGRVYGSAGVGYVRFSLVVDESVLTVAMDRLKVWRKR